MKAPFSQVVVLLAAGILLGRQTPSAPWWLFAAAFAVGLGALAVPRIRAFGLALLTLLVGWVNYARFTAIVSPDDLRKVTGPEQRLATVRGTLHTTPGAHVFERRGRESWHSSALIDARQILIDGTWRRAEGRLVAFATGVLPAGFCAGQNVEVDGVLAAPAGPRAEGLFDSRAYYASQGIYRELRTESTAAWRLPASPRPPPAGDRFTAWATNILALGMPAPLDTPTQLIETLALDWKAPLTGDIEEPFVRAGTFHIFAVDGLRIGLITAICLGLLRALRVPRVWCGVAVIPLIWGYAGLTGWPASAIRATIMTTVIVTGWSLHRPVNLLNSLCVAAAAILLWQPTQLFQAGFQMSFLVVWSIALIGAPLKEWLMLRLTGRDSFLPPVTAAGVRGVFRQITVFLIDTVVVSVAAWVGSIPLAAAYFHIFAPVSVPANIVVVPATALALVAAAGSVLTGAWLPGVAALFNHSAWLCMNGIARFSGWSAKWPGACFNVPAPTAVEFVLFYALLALVATGWLFRSRFKFASWIVLAATAVFCVAERMADTSVARLHIVPVSGGAVLAAQNFSRGQTALFDCGNELAAGRVVKPFLAAHGVNNIDAMALTVAHAAATSGAPEILTNFTVRELWLGDAKTAKHLAAGRQLKDGDIAGPWKALAPATAPAGASADDNALVFQSSIEGISVLLLSSLDRAGQDALLVRHPDLHGDIAIAAMPGRDEPLCDSLLDRLQPKLIVVTDAAYPAPRRAPGKLRARLAARKIPVFYCSDAGYLKITFSKSVWKLEDAERAAVQPARELNGTDPE